MLKKPHLAVIALALVAGLGWFAIRPAAPGKELPGAAMAQSADVGEIDTSRVVEMVMGSPDAPVTVVEYASFTCPHCGTFHNTVFEQIKANYIDTGRVRLIYREVYFDRFGLWAAMVARCGGPMRYFGIADMIYERQEDWTASGDPAVIAGELRTIGKAAGLTDAELDACMADAGMAQALVAVYQRNAEADGIESTPTFIIDGVKHGNMSYEDFARRLDDALASN